MMDPSWVAIWLTAAGMAGALLLVLIKVAVSLSGNTKAINSLTSYMDKKDKKDAEQDARLDEHDLKFVEVETIHRLRGCDVGGD